MKKPTRLVLAAAVVGAMALPMTAHAGKPVPGDCLFYGSPEKVTKASKAFDTNGNRYVCSFSVDGLTTSYVDDIFFAI